MSGINKVILLGNVGRDPEIKRLESGVAVANFTLATSEHFKDRNTGDKKEQTEWHNIIGWRHVAESIERSELKKGDRVYLEGKIKSRKWTDKEGNQRQGIEIACDTFTIITRKKAGIEVDAETEAGS